MRTRILVAFVPLLFGMCLAGCQKTPAPLSLVSGRVTFNGMSLSGGTIVFAPDPDKGERGPIAFGRIHPDGSYSLVTGDANGASPGWYRVTVTSQAPIVSQVGFSQNDPPSTIPVKYRDPELSQLACEVKAHQNNTLDFHLK